MNHIYLGIALSLFCVLLAYFILSKFLLVAVFCVIFAGLQFKDDFTLFRFVATHVASLYLWLFEVYYSLQNMYHQSNNTNIPVRKSLPNNGNTTSKLNRLHRRVEGLIPSNPKVSYVVEAQPLSSSSWNTSSNICRSSSYLSNRSQSTLKEMSRLNTSPSMQSEESIGLFRNPINSPLSSNISSPITEVVSRRSGESPISRRMPTNKFNQDSTSKVNNTSPLDVKMYANVNSPGFCSRLADRLTEAMTHQSKYDTVGAFPVVHLKSQSPKIKIKTPVRVRLAPPPNELLYNSAGADSINRSSTMGAEESMKSVLQVLKEISRKRIHSHVDDDCEENSKRLRVSESQPHYNSERVLHTSLLQQTIQGKRAREESSPNEDDGKKRRKPLQNNEILSSLSSSISIKPPHLKTKKRKAQAIEDAVGITPVLGKLLKVQTDVSPPLPEPSPEPTTLPQAILQENETKTPIVPPSSAITVPTEVPSIIQSINQSNTRVAEEPVVVTTPKFVKVKTPEPDHDGTESRLLGRISGQSDPTTFKELPAKKNVFISTNDLSLSPPKENRLAAMIAVLGGPSENLEAVNSEGDKEAELKIHGKALFTSPATPDTPKQGKKVTFSESLTSTKIFDKDQPDNENYSSLGGTSVVTHSTPLSSLNAGECSSPVAVNEKLAYGCQGVSATKPVSLNFGSSSFSPGCIESSKPNAEQKNTLSTTTSTMTSSVPAPGGAASMFSQQKSSFFSPVVTVVSSPNILSSKASGSASINNASIESAAFSFGSTSPSLQKDSTPKQMPIIDHFGNKPLSSISSESKPSQVVSSSLFTTSTPLNEVKELTTTTDANSVGKNKPTFSIFSNKDDTVKSSSKNQSEKKQTINGLPPATSNNTQPTFAFNTPVVQANSQPAFNKPAFQSFGSSTNNIPPTTSTFSFGSTSTLSTSTVAPAPPAIQATVASTLQSPQLFSSNIKSPSTTSQPVLNLSTSINQPVNIFSSAAIKSQTNPNSLATGTQASSQVPSLFGDGSSQIGGSFKPTPTTGAQTSAQTSVFGSNSLQTTGFGAIAASQNGSELKASSQTNNMFGSISNANATTPKSVIFGAGGNIPTQTAHQVFGFSATPSPSLASSSPFGTLTNPTTQPNPLFGNLTTTAQNTTMFGSVTTSNTSQNSVFLTSTATSGQPSFFNSSGSTQTPKTMLSSSSTTTPAFGMINSSSAFGIQSNTPASSFGNQNNTAFGNANNTNIPGFGNQNGLNTSQSVASGIFTTTGSLSLGTSGSNTTETKPQAFDSSSPFMFGNAVPNKEAAKPFSISAPFSFGSNVSQTNPSLANPAQSALPSFSASSPGFGTNQQALTFGAVTSQPPAPAFAFGQGTPTPTPTFQFNAAVPQPGGGMFSIGSGSSAPRSKTGALRRRHKPT